MARMHKHFRELAETLDQMEVCKITCHPDGKFFVPSEKDGRVAQLSPETRQELSEFLRGFADRLLCPNPEHVR